jgi:peptidoglycan/LPS O-acetylase OafA/YrhL
MTNPAGCGSQLKLTAILSSSIFLLIIYCVLQRRAPQGKPHNHKPMSQLLCFIGDYSFGIYLVHMLILKWLQTLDFYNIIPYPINSIAVLAISFIFCCTCSTVFGKKFGRWVGLV